MEWVREQATAKAGGSEYWAQVLHVATMLDGLVAGMEQAQAHAQAQASHVSSASLPSSVSSLGGAVGRQAAAGHVGWPPVAAADQSVSTKELYTEMLMMNSDYDLLEVVGHLFPGGDAAYLTKRGHCRALIKMAADM